MPQTSHELQVQMRKDLFAAYADVASRPCPSQEVAWLRTVKHPAPRYYIGEKKARNILCQIMHGKRECLETMLPYKKRMYLALEQEVLRLSKKREFHNKSMRYIVMFAILQPAPEFFVAWETWKAIFRNAKRYGIDFTWKDASRLNTQYTNRKDNKPKDAVYKGKKHLIISKCQDYSLL